MERIVVDAKSQRKKDFDDLMAGRIKKMPLRSLDPAPVIEEKPKAKAKPKAKTKAKPKAKAKKATVKK